MKLTKQLLTTTLALLLIVSVATAKDTTLKLKVKAGDYARMNVPVCVLIDAGTAKTATVNIGGSSKAERAQLAEPGLLAQCGCKKLDGKKELHFVLPLLAKGKDVDVTVNLSDAPLKGRSFCFNDDPGVSREMACAKCHIKNQSMFKYMYKPLDKENREETYKVFHHLYKPGTTEIITKGPGGKFTHHRGIFYGFSKTSYTDKEGKKVSCDTWHSRGARQEHDKFIAEDTGKVLGRHTVGINWISEKGDDYTFAKEKRQVGAWNLKAPNGAPAMLVEFASELTPIGDTPVNVNGDPQHAGFQFRASNEVASNSAKETYYIRAKDGVGKPGETRNWPGDKEQKDLPYNAMSFVVGGKRYTAVYIDKPSNPKPAMYSERDYGRFGSYFVAEATKEKPLVVNYRIWLQEGEMTPEEVKALADNFVNPVEVEVVK